MHRLQRGPQIRVPHEELGREAGDRPPPQRREDDAARGNNGRDQRMGLYSPELFREEEEEKEIDKGLVSISFF